MVEKNRYLRITICVTFIMALLVGGFFIYKSSVKDTNFGGSKEKEEKKEEIKKNVVTPLLYEVTKIGSDNKIYLFGSIHAAVKEDLDSLPDYVLNAYKNSSSIACELDITKITTDQEAIAKILEIMTYKDGTTIKDHLKEETYKKMVDFLTKKNSYVELYDLYKPAYIGTLLEGLAANDAKLDINSSVDDYIIKKAKKDNKTILELETVEFQYDVLYGFRDEFYEYMVSDYLDNYDKLVTSVSDLYKSWKNGDIEGLLDNNSSIEIKEDFSSELKKDIEDYEKKLINDRNITMTDKAVEYLENKQDVFFMVGAAHIVGDNGIAKLLEAKGYTVTQVK